MEYPLTRLKWSPEAVSAIFWRAHQWVDWEELVQQAKKTACKEWWRHPMPFPSKSLEKTLQARWIDIDSKFLGKKSTIWGCAGLIFLYDFALIRAVVSDFLAHLSIWAPLEGPFIVLTSGWECAMSSGTSQADCAADSLQSKSLTLLQTSLQRFSQLFEPSWC